MRACQASQDWKESKETKEALGSLVRLRFQMYQTCEYSVLNNSLLCFCFFKGQPGIPGERGNPGLPGSVGESGRDGRVGKE